MKRITIILLFISLQAAGQKKVSPVSQSTLTGIALPPGSKQENRILMEASGKILLETETKKANTTISKTEIFYLPVSTVGFNSDSLVSRLSSQGWNIIPVAGDNKYVWLQKDKRSIITYFSMGKKETNLYFGEVTGTPLIAGNGNNNNSNQNTTVTTQPTTGQTVQQQTVQTTTGGNTNTGNGVQSPPNNPTPATSSGFAFSTTNFDDGWTSTVQENWVEVTKGEIKVLLHYPRAEEKQYIPQQVDQTKTFWNLLVAPRYSNLSNFELLQYHYSSEPAHFAAGNLTDNTGKTVYVVLFKKAQSGWIEFITPDRNSFVNYFHINNPDSYFGEWDPLLKLAGYNRFAIGPGDLPGKWSNDFSSVSSLYNIYTGIYAGASSYASRQTFTFTDQKNYHWKIMVSQGRPGDTKLDQAESNGTYQLKGNWQVAFSNIDKKAKLYNSYFSCIKGARLLWLQDVEYGSYTCYGLL